MLALHGVAVFVGAALVFLVQPDASLTTAIWSDDFDDTLSIVRWH